jgi:predicted dehydrogenase
MHVFQADSCVWVDYDKHKVRLYRKRATNIDPYAVDPTSLPDVTDFVFRELLSVEDIPVAQTNALEQELATFLNCVMTGDQPICSGAEARARIELAMRIVTAINGNLSRHLGSA